MNQVSTIPLTVAFVLLSGACGCGSGPSVPAEGERPPMQRPEKAKLVRLHGPGATMIDTALQMHPDNWKQVRPLPRPRPEIHHGGAVTKLPEVGICQEAELPASFAQAFPDSQQGDLTIHLVAIVADNGLVAAFTPMSPWFRLGEDPAKDAFADALVEMFDHWRGYGATVGEEKVYAATLLQLTLPQGASKTEGCYESFVESVG